MPPSLDNPFRKPPRSKTEAEEVSELLTGKERKGEKEVKEEMVSEDAVIELSTEEQKLADRAENKPWTREQMEEWAKKFKLSANWVDENLKENADGSWSGLHIDLNFLRNSVDFPRGITAIRSLYLDNITSLEGVTLPESIGENLILRSLTSTEDLNLPKDIGGTLDLRSITSLKGVILPKSIGQDLILQSLITAEDLILPEGFDGKVYLESLSEEEKEKLQEKYPNAKIV